MVYRDLWRRIWNKKSHIESLIVKRTSVGEEESGVIEGDDRARLPVDVIFVLEEAEESVPHALRRPLHIVSLSFGHGFGCGERRRRMKGSDGAKGREE